MTASVPTVPTVPRAAAPTRAGERAGARAAARVRALDRAVARRVLSSDRAGVDHVMRWLSTSADHSKIWVAVAAVLAARGRGAQREGAATGIASAALASLVVNQGVKRLVPRRRPDLADLPALAARRALRRVPTSSSFPSGHAASAAAFATGVGLRAPGTLVVLAPLAVAVGYSRTHTGVHFASDVVVGAGIGVGVAMLVDRSVRRAARPPGPAAPTGPRG